MSRRATAFPLMPPPEGEPAAHLPHPESYEPLLTPDPDAEHAPYSAPLFSSGPEPPLESPHVFEAGTSRPRAPGRVFSSEVNLAHDRSLVRAAAAADRALALLRTFRGSRAEPIPRSLAVAIEAAASAWMDEFDVVPSEVVRLLDPGGLPPLPLVRGTAAGLDSLLESTTGTTWDLALRFASSLGSPRYAPAVSPSPTATPTVLEQMAGIVAVGHSRYLGPLAGVTVRALVASWPARAGRLDPVPLIVSPSLAAADDRYDRTDDPARTVMALLVAIEDSALRMLRAEQATADLHRHYLDQMSGGTRTMEGHGRPKLADKSDSRQDRADAERRLERAVSEVFLHPVVTAASVAERLDEPGAGVLAADLVAEMERRGWLWRLEPPVAQPEAPARWLAREVVDAATRPFAGQFDPREPAFVDITAATRPLAPSGALF